MKKFDLISEGIITPGFNDEIVIKNLVATLKITEKQASALIQRNGYKLKQKIDETQGLKYLNALRAKGLNVKLTEVLIDTNPLDDLKPTNVAVEPASPKDPLLLDKPDEADKREEIDEPSPPKPIYASTIEELSLVPLHSKEEEKESDTKNNQIASESSALALQTYSTESAINVNKKRKESQKTHHSNNCQKHDQDDVMIDDFDDDMDDKPSLFSKEGDGRYGRLDYLNGLVIVFGLYIGFFIFINTLPLAVTKLLFVAPTTLLTFRIVKFRMQDVGISGSFFGTIAMILAALNLWTISLSLFCVNLLYLIAIFLLPGTKKKNNYGYLPKKPNNWGVIAIIPVTILMSYLTYQEYTEYTTLINELSTEIERFENMTDEEWEEYYNNEYYDE